MDPRVYLEHIGEKFANLEAGQKLEGFRETGLTKSLYLDIIEKVIDIYTTEYLWKMAKGEIDFVICIGLRAAGAIAYLLSEGRRPDLYELWLSLMYKSCEQFSLVFGHAEYDLAVKEVMIALKLMKDRLPKEDFNYLYDRLKSIDPYKTYGCIIGENKDTGKLCNMTVYNSAGEYLRETEGMVDTAKYFDEHMPWAVSRFDDFGMWVPLDNSMLYDLTTRCQFSVMLYFGYDGKYAGAIDRNLEKGGMMTLLMQSAAFQIPYGGRSNQYLFNEALAASCCEYEARRHMKAGRKVLAGMFKRCARKSAETVYTRLVESRNHIKNYFDPTMAFGIDGYGTFHRYLIATAVFIGYGILFSDESIKEYPCPSEIGGYVLPTSDKFHKVFANCAGQSLEIETKADSRYDSTGLGRYHKAGFPIDLALSLPITSEPKYRLPEDIPRKNASICTGIEYGNGDVLWLCDQKDKLDAQLNVINETNREVSFSVEYRSKDETTPFHVTETYTLNDEGLQIESAVLSEDAESVLFSIPLFESNGRDVSAIDRTECEKESTVIVSVKPYRYILRGEGPVSIDKKPIANRNAIYRRAVYKSSGKRMRIHLSLEKE
jgi:hypothetical protein